MEKAKLPKPPVHHSYKVHRNQVITQIIMPVLLSTLLLFVGIILLIRSTFYGGGDVGRWAAVSTMWILTPVILIGIIVLAVLMIIIYYFSQALGALPKYTSMAQDYIYHARTYIIHAAKAVERPVRALTRVSEKIQEFFSAYMP